MAMSKCGSCGGHLFQLHEVTPSGAAFRYQFIQCTTCGVPVTAVEWTTSARDSKRSKTGWTGSKRGWRSKGNTDAGSAVSHSCHGRVRKGPF